MDFNAVKPTRYILNGEKILTCCSCRDGMCDTISGVMCIFFSGCVEIYGCAHWAVFFLYCLKS